MSSQLFRRSNFSYFPRLNNRPTVVSFILGICVGGLTVLWISLFGSLLSYHNNNNNRPHLQQTVETASLSLTTQDNQIISSSVIGRKRLGDGCRFVFLDVGSNIGVQVRKLFEGEEKYPDAPFVAQFKKRFGTLEERRRYACAFGIVANPRHQSRLKEIENCYNNRLLGWRTKFFVPNIADNVDGRTIEFFEESGKEEDNNWASSVFFNPHFNYTSKVKVTSIDLGSFIMNEIVGREIPAGPGTPFILMKMDIEGSEYQVLPDLLAKGALCHINEAMVEYHRGFMETNEDKERAGAVTSFMSSFKKLPVSAFGCKRTEFNKQDEETYGNDGKPLPDECLS